MTTIVLLPGMDGTGRLFTPFVEYLPKNWNVTVVCYPKIDPLGYEALVREARKAIPTVGNYFILGESFSGPIAISLAKSADNRLLGLILCCTFMRCPSKLLHYSGAVFTNYPVSMIPFFVIEAMLLGKFRTPVLSNLVRSAVYSVSDVAYKARLRAIQAVDVSAELASLVFPVLYLRAVHDRLVSEHESKAMRWTMKHMSIAELDGPHCLLQASPCEAAYEVTHFVKGLENANGSKCTI